MNKMKTKPAYVPQVGCMTVATYRKHTKVFVKIMKQLLEKGEFDSMDEDELVDCLVEEFVNASDPL